MFSPRYSSMYRDMKSDSTMETHTQVTIIMTARKIRPPFVAGVISPKPTVVTVTVAKYTIDPRQLMTDIVVSKKSVAQRRNLIYFLKKMAVNSTGQYT